MPRTAVLGFPRIGPNRELKFALERYWAGELDESGLLATGRRLRAANWTRAQSRGINVIPCGEFSLYDHVLDTAWALGAVPERFGDPAVEGLAAYLAMARGGEDARPLEMTKWFDTNYHYLVPELTPGQGFTARAERWTDQLHEARELGIAARPVVLGPCSFLLLSKGLDKPLDSLPALLPAYTELLSQLSEAGAGEVQVDEPCLTLDLAPEDRTAIARAWDQLASAAVPRLALTTYFAGFEAGETIEWAMHLGADEIHLDLVRDPAQLPAALDLLKHSDKHLSLGVIDGRNVWATDMDAALERIDAAVDALGPDRVTIAPSCSLLHLPVSVAAETGIDAEVRRWLKFADERLDELSLLARAAGASAAERDELLAPARGDIRSRRESELTNNVAVRERAAALTASDHGRRDPYSTRRALQRERVPLPELPATTIGSFPQTPQIREARRTLRAGELSAEQYDAFIKDEIRHVVEVQERLGLDLLVHGEPERNDMVEYFGQQLDGFAFSANGWVQSYGSRCVKPPILFGDVSRPRKMTVDWWRFAQSLTERPMKAMLTGPVTILQWSFVRDDQPRSDTCVQIALAIQDEMVDLESAGAFAVQVDEAAIREGLPLQRRNQDDYLRWAVDCFRLTVAPAAGDTQIHTHMCYSDFNGIMEHIARLDADVLSIEASRSDMVVLDAFTGDFHYPNEIGPGVYDIHSPRIPLAEEIERLLELAELRIPREQLWVNPDCGLKTRSWEQVLPALENMMAAARRRRAVNRVVS